MKKILLKPSLLVGMLMFVLGFAAHGEDLQNHSPLGNDPLGLRYAHEIVPTLFFTHEITTPPSPLKQQKLRLGLEWAAPKKIPLEVGIGLSENNTNPLKEGELWIATHLKNVSLFTGGYYNNEQQSYGARLGLHSSYSFKYADIYLKAEGKYPIHQKDAEDIVPAGDVFLGLKVPFKNHD